MSIVLGFYTEISETTPTPVYERAISLIYEPFLSFLYNHPNSSLTLYQSSAMTRYIKEQKPEIRSLLSLSAGKGSLEILTGPFTQSIISLMPPKERANQIEKMTSLIRHDYGLLSRSAFFYGQIWTPQFISTLKNCGIDSVLISAYSGISRKNLYNRSFMMNELGRRITVYVISDQFASLISSYGQGELSLESLEQKIDAILEGYIDQSDELIAMINMDQLISGALRRDEIHRLHQFLNNLFSRYAASLAPLSKVAIHSPGYLPSGWYGRDAWSNGLTSFNDIFVRNENFRYIFNRYISLVESIPRSNKVLKNDVERALFSIEAGPLFIHDGQCTPLRYAARRYFWKQIIEAEDLIYRETGSSALREYDLEEIGLNSKISENKNYIVTLSPKGGAVSEFDYKAGGINLFDNRAYFDKEFNNAPLKKSFTTNFTFNGRRYRTEDKLFLSDSLDRRQQDNILSLDDEELPVTIVKHFKLRNQTFTMDMLLYNKSGEDLEGEVDVELYFDSDELLLALFEQKREMLTHKSVEARTVRYAYKEQTQGVVISSTQAFTLSEDIERQGQYTSNGFESFVLYKRLDFRFRVVLEKEGSHTIRLALRVNDMKERE